MHRPLLMLVTLFGGAALGAGHPVDLGVSGGVNTPAGFGVEAIWRIDRIAALGGAAGYGSWGPKVSLIGRVHLENSVAQGLFLEPSISINFGGLFRMPTSNVPVVGNVTVAGGYRWSFADRFWVVLRVGQAFSFGAPATTSTASTAPGNAGEQLTRMMFQSDTPPAGWVLGLATGASI